jgi:phosphate:Na+ symporter
VRKLNAMRLPPALVEAVAHSLRALQYQESAVTAVRQACALATTLGAPPGAGLEPVAAAFRQAAGALAASADAAREDFSAPAVEVRLEEAELRYQAFKEALLLEGAHARIDIRSMQDWLRLASLERRAIEQVAKAARMLAVLDGDLTPQQAAEKAGGNGVE